MSRKEGESVERSFVIEENECEDLEKVICWDHRPASKDAKAQMISIGTATWNWFTLRSLKLVGQFVCLQSFYEQLLLVHKVSQDRTLCSGIRRLPWHNDIVSIGIVNLDVHRSPRCTGDWGRPICTGSNGDDTVLITVLLMCKNALWWSISPATETNALCSAVPPLVTMRSV